MFKLSRGWARATFKLECFLFVKEAGFYTKLWTIDNKSKEGVASILQGRLSICDAEEVAWAIEIARKKNHYALIGDAGSIKPVPINQRRDRGTERSVLQTEKDTTKIKGYRIGSA